MTNVIQYALLGLGLGAIYTLLGQGVVLIYRGSGVLNIAHGGFAMFGAYLYLQLHVPSSLGASYSSQPGWPVLPAFLAAVSATAAIGLATDRLLLRGMRNASPLSRLIATVGVLLVLIAAASKIWGASPPFVPAILPTSIWQLSPSVTLPSSYAWMVGIAVAITVLLTVVWRFTRIGWVTAAVSQNERGAAALGISPGFVSSATWTAGAGLAAAAGILLTPITQISVGSLSLLIIPVLAALLLGGFQSFPATLASGMFVGVAQTVAVNYNDFFEKHLHITMTSDAFPVLVVLLVMIVRGSSLPLRGHIGERLPAIGTGRIRWRIVLPTIAIGSGLIVALSSNPTVMAALTVTFIAATLLLSLVVLMGYAGQISLAQYALAGVGGLLAARLAQRSGLDLVPALAVGVLGAMVAGLIIAIPALRLRGVNLAVITLAAAWAVHDMVFTNPQVSGETAGVSVGRATLFGWEISGQTHPGRYAAFTLAIFALACVLVANIRRSRLGRNMIAVRSNERAAAASGVSVFRTKLLAFAISGAIAGSAGTMLAFQYESTSFVTLDAFTSLLAVAWVVIGGVGFIMGALLGALLAPGAVLSLLGSYWHGFGEWLALIGGVGALLAVRFNQDGVVYGLRRAFSQATAKIPQGRPTSHRGDDVAIPPKIEPTCVVPQRLQIENLTVRYGGIVAVDAIGISVAPGEVVGLIGPNGAGKTSLMDAVSGFAHYEGNIRLGHERIDQWSAHRRARSGLVRSFQGLELFPEMTVLENLQVPGHFDGGASALIEILRPRQVRLSEVTLAAIQDFGLAPILHKFPDEISYGQRRLVAIARAVAAQPSVLLLDEPVAGLSEHESHEFAILVRQLANAWGMAILVIEHDMGFVMNTCDRITVINFGKHVCTGTPDEVRADRAAIAAYLGDEASPDPADPIPVSETETRTPSEARL
ncbi:ATP-binding cassette domain-containing protein [Nocardia sp. NPDC059240]|uniref:ABC transporter permease subunit n=1 Tax=Nocardia sp. NPDC059240 TaxID=3346786 RepID=UPI0036CDBC82